MAGKTFLFSGNGSRQEAEPSNMSNTDRFLSTLELMTTLYPHFEVPSIDPSQLQHVAFGTIQTLEQGALTHLRPEINEKMKELGQQVLRLLRGEIKSAHITVHVDLTTGVDINITKNNEVFDLVVSYYHARVFLEDPLVQDAIRAAKRPKL